MPVLTLFKVYELRDRAEIIANEPSLQCPETHRLDTGSLIVNFPLSIPPGSHKNGNEGTLEVIRTPDLTELAPDQHVIIYTKQ